MRLPPEPKKGDKLICPVCGKEFKASDDTKYISSGEYLDTCGYTCSWKCFLDSGKNHMSDKKKSDKVKETKSVISIKKPKDEQNTIISNVSAEPEELFP